jgi:hypothetical protein
MTPDEMMEHLNHADAVAAVIARWGAPLARRAYACAMRGRESAAWYGYDHTKSAFVDYGELSWLRVSWGSRVDGRITVVRVGDDVAALGGFEAFSQMVTAGQPDVVLWRDQILLAFAKLLNADVFDDVTAALFKNADGELYSGVEPPHFEDRRFVFCARVPSWKESWATIVTVRIDADTYRVDAEDLETLLPPPDDEIDDDDGVLDDDDLPDDDVAGIGSGGDAGGGDDIVE